MGMQVLEKHDLGDLFEIELNGHTVRCKVTAKVIYDEYWTIDESLCEGDDLVNLQRELESCRVTPIMIMVEAHALGMEGIDSLGGVLVRNPEDVTETISENGMIGNSLSDLKRAIEDQIETLKPYMKAA